jgi:RimJ/RimL family protein N-acetyltransferase
MGPISLRPFDETDFPGLIGWIDSREALIQWAGPAQFTFPLTSDQLHAYLKGCAGDRPERKAYAVSTNDKVVCGHIELGAIQMENETATLCRVLVAPAAGGKGLSLPMVQEVLRIGFSDLHLRRIDLRVYGFNTAAIRCYERAGFVREGLLRKSQKVGQQYWDTVVMAILREEWEQLK